MERSALAWWLAMGSFAAVAAQFLYSAIGILAGIALACALSPRQRSQWRRPGIYLAALIAAASLLPALVWNQSHGWPVSALGTWRSELTPHWEEIGTALWAGMLLASVPIVVAAIFGLAVLARSSRTHSKPRLLLCLTAPFAVIWFTGMMRGNVSATSLLLTMAIAICGAASVFQASQRLRLVGAAALVLAVASSVFPLRQQIDPWTRSVEGIAWHDLAAETARLLPQIEAAKSTRLFLIAQDPSATAALNYYLARSPATRTTEVFLRESQDLSTQFGLWPRYDDFVVTDKPADELFQMEGNTTNPYMGRSALYLSDEEPDDLPQTIKSAFSNVSPYATLTLEGGRKMRVYLCEDYQTMPL
jgi:hypothetical protein